MGSGKNVTEFAILEIKLQGIVYIYSIKGAIVFMREKIKLLMERIIEREGYFLEPNLGVDARETGDEQ